MNQLDDRLVYSIITCAMEVHSALGPGLPECVYEECLCLELRREGLRVDQQKEIPLFYEGKELKSSFRIDLLVEGRVVIELKAVDLLLPIHKARVSTYLKLGDFEHGVLINFNEVFLKKGICRVYKKIYTTGELENRSWENWIRRRKVEPEERVSELEEKLKIGVWGDLIRG